MLEVNNLTKEFKVQLRSEGRFAAAKDFFNPQYQTKLAVNDISFQIDDGEIVAYIGPNGSGKSTTIKMLSCLTSPASADAFLKGKSICKDPAAVKSIIAVSPQESAIAPGLSVYENLELICGVHGFSKEKTKSKIEELSAQFALDIVLKRKASVYSI